MPPVFGLPPAIQKISREAGQRLRGGVRVGRLGVVDEQHLALAADLLHAVREAGKRTQPLLDRSADRPSASAGAGRAGGVLRIVQRRAASRCRRVCAIARAVPPAARMICSAST